MRSCGFVSQAHDSYERIVTSRCSADAHRKPRREIVDWRLWKGNPRADLAGINARSFRKPQKKMMQLRSFRVSTSNAARSSSKQRGKTNASAKNFRMISHHGLIFTRRRRGPPSEEVCVRAHYAFASGGAMKQANDSSGQERILNPPQTVGATSQGLQFQRMPCAL